MRAFFRNNPWSKLDSDSPTVLKRPWGDQSFDLMLDRLDNAAIKRLSGLTLFPAFSAIFHNRRRSLECIYTPFRQHDVVGRKFKFTFNGKEMECDFAPPSQHLFDLAAASEPIAARSETNYRNLRDFRRYMSILEQDHHRNIQRTISEIYEPVSFWIHSCPCDEEELKDICEHINFYTSYFDRTSPYILIHEKQVEDDYEPEVRYLWDKFPESIRAKSIDPYLLGQWVSARDAGDTYRSFLYYFQMLEYAAFYYLSDKTKRAIDTILVAPQTSAFPDEAWQRIQDVLALERIEDSAKLVAVVSQLVDPESLWKEIESNRDCFQSPIEFDGGFVVPEIIASSTDLDGFKAGSMEKLVHTIRSIRNALVHAREKRMSNVIAPTVKNHRLVQPFLRPLSVIAMQVAVGVSGGEATVRDDLAPTREREE